MWLFANSYDRILIRAQVREVCSGLCHPLHPAETASFVLTGIGFYVICIELFQLFLMLTKPCVGVGVWFGVCVCVCVCVCS